MTVVNPKSISGITSITTASGSDNLLTIHTSDASNTERFRIDSTGTTKIVTGIVTTLTATTGIVTTFEATTGDITTLRTPTGIATHFTADKISLPDSSDGSLCIGIGSDLKLNHNGTDSFITEVGGGDLYIQGSDIIIRDAGTLDKYIEMTQNGAVDLYYDNSKKFETTSDGVTLTGNLSIDDKIVHTGDTNTAIRFPAADTITAETGGSERVRIDSSGRVGLGGQTSPSATIHIQDLSSHGYELKLGGNAITFNRASLSYIDQINDSGSLVFRTTSSQTNALTIASNGNITANAGNFVIGTSGKGIDFSNAADQASGETATESILYDYEAGSFEPSIQGSAGSGMSFSASSYNGGYYVRVGRIVHISMNVRGTFTLGSGSGGVIITNLPFTSGNTEELSGCGNAPYAALSIPYHSGLTALSGYIISGGMVVPNTTNVNIYQQQTGAANNPTVAINTLSTGSDGVNIHISGSYLAT